jgi:hypothetical protein
MFVLVIPVELMLLQSMKLRLTYCLQNTILRLSSVCDRKSGGIFGEKGEEEKIMAIYNIFSKRMKAERGEVPDVYQYKTFEDSLRVKIVHIIGDGIGQSDNMRYIDDNYYKGIIDILCREYGIFELIDGGKNHSSPYDHLMNYFIQEKNIEKALDVVELCFNVIDTMIRKNNSSYAILHHIKLYPDEAIKDLNDRFKEHGFGYKYESGIIMKITSEFNHTEIVRPALKLLSDKRFEGAQQEFLSAHKNYRNKNNKECINDCLKSFESMMKTICKIRKYQINDNATSKVLIAKLFDEEYIPKYLQSHCNALQSILESGVPTIRNKIGGHGQGEKVIDVDDNYAEFALNMTASNIVFLTSLLR